MRPDDRPKNDESPAIARLVTLTGATGLEPATSGVTERGFAERSRWKTLVLLASASLSRHLFTRRIGPLQAARVAMASSRVACVDVADLHCGALWLGAQTRNDGLRWPRRDGLKWPHLASVVVGVDLA